MSKEVREQINRVKNWKQSLNENVNNILKNVSEKYSNKNVMYHCSDDFRYKFDLSYVKGEHRGIHGWGIYFASTVFKASNYGDYLTIVDKSNLKLLSFNETINDDFIQNIKNNLDHNNFNSFRDLINTNNKFENLRDFDFDKLDDLKDVKYRLESRLINVRNNKEYNEITSIINNIDELLNETQKVIGNNDNDELLGIVKKNIGGKINDLLIYIFNNKPQIYEKKLSLFFAECGYDGFNYDDYEYIIFKTNNLKILNHVRIR